MSNNYNKVIQMGYLTKDPVLSQLPSGTSVVDFGIANNHTYTDRDGNERKETNFIGCRAFGKTAEIIARFFTKGKPIFLEGRLLFDRWTGTDGVQHSRHRIHVEKFQFVGSKSEQPTNPPEDDNKIPDEDIPF